MMNLNKYRSTLIYLLFLATGLLGAVGRGDLPSGPSASQSPFGASLPSSSARFDRADEDPLGILAAAEETAVDPADVEARNAATQLRVLALREVQKRQREILGRHDAYQVTEFNRLLEMGNFVFEHSLGTAKVRMIDGDYAIKVTLSKRRFPRAQKTVFVVFNFESLKPDPKRVALLLAVLQKRGEFTDAQVSDLVSSEQKLEEFIIEAGRSQGIPPDEISNWLKAGSGELRQYLSSLVLHSDVQALGLKGENILYAFYGRKPKFFSGEYWQRWFESVRGPVTAGSVTMGLVCGGVQAASTYWMASAVLGRMIVDGTMAQQGMWVGYEWIPLLAAAWSFTYGFTLAAFNPVYRNIVYHGSTQTRLLKLSIFGGVFAYVYEAITAPFRLMSLGEQGHIWTNILVNQYAKDDAYRIARIRESLRLNQGEVSIPTMIPPWARKLFPNLLGRIPEKISIKIADIETQGSYHLLWALKMLHFVHLMPVAVLPVAIVIARVSAYGYLGYLYFERCSEYRRAPMPEKLRQLREIRRFIKELNRSWLDIVFIPYQVLRTAWRGVALSVEKGREVLSGVSRSHSRRPEQSCVGVYQGLVQEIPSPLG